MLSHKSNRNLFDITLSYEYSDHSWKVYNANNSTTRIYNNIQKQALDISVKEYNRESDVEIDFNYRLDIFNEEDMDNITNSLMILMEKTGQSPELKVSDYSKLFYRSARLIDRRAGEQPF